MTRLTVWTFLVVLGTTQVLIHRGPAHGRGAVIGLDAHENDDVQILANNIPSPPANVLRGDRIGITITEVLFARPVSARATTFAGSDGSSLEKFLTDFRSVVLDPGIRWVIMIATMRTACPSKLSPVA